MKLPTIPTRTVTISIRVPKLPSFPYRIKIERKK
jgi:hypothetical protein